MTKLKEEMFRAYADISHSSKSEEIVDAIVEVSKKYIEKAFIDSALIQTLNSGTGDIKNDLEQWLKENIE